ncbi:immune inhibitor A, partial [bacterium]|nr:immune inhibitor A [bacterium]
MYRSFATSLSIALVFLLTIGVAFGAVVSQSDYDMLKTKLAAGETLSRADINMIIDLHDAGMSVVDDWELGQLKEFGYIGERPAPARRPGNTLDEYIYSEITYDFHDITAEPGVVQLPNPTDDGVQSPFALGFNFPLYDATMSEISICSNGFISNAANTSGDYSNNPIPDPLTPNPVIAPFWDDLNPANTTTPGQIYFWADPSSDRAIVQWVNCVGLVSAGVGPQTFQCQLFANGNIEYHYQTINGGDLCTVGIENSTGTEGLQVCFDGTGWIPTSGSAIIIGEFDGVPQPVTGLTGAQVASDVVLNWTDPTQDTNGNPITPTNIQVWLGVPGVGTLLGTVGAGVGTYTHLNAPDGNLTYYVRAYLNPYYSAPASVNVVVGNPSYAEDFEATDGMWVADTGWEWGIPTVEPSGAHSGTHCWGTVMNADYPNSACLNVILDPSLSIISPGATFEFWMWYQIETSWDGCNFSVSTDGGATWTLVEPEGGYPGATNTSNTCNPSQPAWTNSTGTGGWVYVVIPIGQFVGQVPQFKFTLGSDSSIPYPGFFFDDVTIWGLAPPVGAPVSGTVTLDGGAGNMTSVTVRADGLGNPVTNPAANGTYTLENVLVGNRIVWAELAGYHNGTANVNVPEGGVTGINLTLVRLDPPVPTGLEATVSNTTGIASLTWDPSADPLVDRYNVYRKLQEDANYVNIGSSGATSYDDDLNTPGPGIYQYAITAVDLDVTTPVESEMTAPVTVLYGELPPSGLSANGNFDDKIVLDWFEPGTPPEFELFYDNGVNEIGGLGFWQGAPTFGWMVTKFQTVGGPITVTRIKAYITDSALEGDVFEIGVFADNGGVPTFTPLGVTPVTQQGPFNAWFEWDLAAPVTLPDGIAWVGHRQITAMQGVSVGGDQTTAFPANTFKYSFDAAAWTAFEPDLMVIPMQRCFAIGQFGALVELMPSPIDVERMPSQTVENKDAKSITTVEIPDNRMTSSGDYQYDFRSILSRAAKAVAPHAPYFRPVEMRRNNNSLDDVEYYIVYRDGADVGHPTIEHFEDTGRTENVQHSYHVTAYYDNAVESGPTGTVTAACNMAPAAPTNVSVVSVPPSSAYISWIDPIANADGSPCVDLANIQVFRDGSLVATVAAGTEEYTDTPPQSGYYLWTLRAIDEVPNVSEASNGAGGIAGNPSYFSDFETDDGGWVSDNPDGWQWGTPTNGPGAAQSGTNCWGTVLAADYPAGACYQLTLNPEMPIT